MQILIMRHGQACHHANSDKLRELTLTGKREAGLISQWIIENNVTIDDVWVSPYKRAQQTCKELRPSFSSKIDPKTVGIITPEGNAKDIHDLIDGEYVNSNMDTLLIVSHMPVVSYLVAELTSQQHCPIFQTAGLCIIDYNEDKMSGEFIGMVSPSDVQ